MLVRAVVEVFKVLNVSMVKLYLAVNVFATQTDCRKSDRKRIVRMETTVSQRLFDINTSAMVNRCLLKMLTHQRYQCL